MKNWIISIKYIFCDRPIMFNVCGHEFTLETLHSLYNLDEPNCIEWFTIDNK